MKKGIDQEIFKIIINSNPKRSPDGQVREIKQIFKELFDEAVGMDCSADHTDDPAFMDVQHVSENMTKELIRERVKEKLK
jgi:hypothetical protein